MESEDRKPIFTKRLILIVLAVILLALIIFLLLRKCGSGGEKYLVGQIEINPTRVNLKVGETQPVYANVYPVNATNPSVSWTIENPSIAIVNGDGIVTGLHEGVTTLVASANDGSGKYGSVTVTVDSKLPDLEQIQLNKSVYSIKVGKTAFVEATPVPATAQLLNLEYTTNDTSIATVDNTGVIKGIKKGTTRLLVTANDGTIQASATINVTSNSSGGISKPTTVHVKRIDFSGTEDCYKLKVGKSYQLSPIITPTNATSKNLKWEIVNTKSPNDASKNKQAQEYASVDSNGLVTTLKAGTISVKAQAESGVYSLYELRIISSGTEGYCTQSTNVCTNNCSSSGGKTNKTTTTPIDEIVVDNEIIIDSEDLYINGTSGKIHNVKITGIIRAENLDEMVISDKAYLKEAKCDIQISGDLGFRYKAYWYDSSGNANSFVQYAFVPVKNYKGGIKVEVYSYDIYGRMGKEETTVCDSVKIKDKNYNILIDNDAPTCSLNYTPGYKDSNGTNINGELEVSMSDTGGSGLSKYTLNNNDGGSIEDPASHIVSFPVSGPKTYNLVVIDKAGNVCTASTKVEKINESSVNVTASEINTSLESIEISPIKTLFPGDSETISINSRWASGDITTAILDKISCGFENIVNGVTLEGFTINVTKDFSGPSKNMRVNCTYKDGKVNKSASRDFVIKSTGKIVPSISPGNGRDDNWYTGIPTVSLTIDGNYIIDNVKVWAENYDGLISNTNSSTKSGSNVEVALAGTPNGQQIKICYRYQIRGNSDLNGEGCFGTKYDYDNKAPICTSDIVGSTLHFNARDDESGIKKFKNENIGNHRVYDKVFKLGKDENGNSLNSGDTFKVIDGVGNSADCTIPAYKFEQLEKASKNEATIILTYTSGKSERIRNVGNETEASITIVTPIYTGNEDTDLSNINYLLQAFGSATIIEKVKDGSNLIIKTIGEGFIKVKAVLNGVIADIEVPVFEHKVKPEKITLVFPNSITVGTITYYSVAIEPSNASEEYYLTTNPEIIYTTNGSSITIHDYSKKDFIIYAVSKEDKNVKSNEVKVSIIDTKSEVCEMNYDNNLLSVKTIADGKVLSSGYQKKAYKEWVRKDVIPGRTYTFHFEDENSTRGSCSMTIPIDANEIPIEGNTILMPGDSTKLSVDDFYQDYSWESTNQNCVIIDGNINSNVVKILAKYPVTACRSTIILNAKLGFLPRRGVVEIMVNPISNVVEISGNSTLKQKEKSTLSVKNFNSMDSEWSSNNESCVSITKIDNNSATIEAKSTSCTAKISFVGSDPNKGQGTAIKTIIVNSELSRAPASCSMKYEGSSNKLITTINAQNVQQILYNASDWTSNGNNVYERKFNSTYISNSFSAQIYYKDGISEIVSCEYTFNSISISSGKKALISGEETMLVAEANLIGHKWFSSDQTCITLDNYESKSPKAIAKNVTSKCTTKITLTAKNASGKTGSGSITITVNPKGSSNTVPTPSLYFGCGTSQYTEGSWCKYNVSVKASNASNVDAIATCVTTGISCVPTNTTSPASISTSGKYKFCAKFIKDGVSGPSTCTPLTQVNISNPTCSLTFTSTGVNGKGHIYATIDNSGAGVAATDPDYEPSGNRYLRTISSTGSYSFTFKDKIGKQATCSIKIGEEYRKNSCNTYTYGTPEVETINTCTPSGTQGKDLTYVTCNSTITSGTAKTYCYNNTGTSSYPQTINKGFTGSSALKDCKDEAYNICNNASKDFDRDTCSSALKATKTTYNATKCEKWTYGSFTSIKPSSCTNSISCKVESRLVKIN